MSNAEKKGLPPIAFIVIAVVYIINPFDVPGPIDDILVTITMCVIAGLKAVVKEKAKEAVGFASHRVQNATEAYVSGKCTSPETINACKGVINKTEQRCKTVVDDAVDDLSNSAVRKFGSDRSFQKLSAFGDLNAEASDNKKLSL